MRREETKEKKQNVGNRLAALIVAVVFVLGMMCEPAGSYAVEQDAPSVGGQATEVVETTGTAESEGEQAPAEEITAEEPQKTLTEETATEAEETSSEEAVEALNDAVTVDLDSIDESEYDGFIYKLADDTTKKEIKEMESAIDDLDGSEEQEVSEVIDKELYAADSIETIAEVAKPEVIEYIEPNFILHALDDADELEELDDPDDPEYTNHSWQLVNTNVPKVWGMGLFGDGAVVAVLDSGVNMGHSDLRRDSFVHQKNIITGTNAVTDRLGHGTMVTGIIAETRNNGIGFTGAMPDTKIVPVKVLDDFGRSDSITIIKGIQYALDCTEPKVDVINMSFGGSFHGTKPKALEDACKTATDRGVILVAAAGNEAQGDDDGNINPIEYPAAFDCVVSVGSVGETNEWSTFSNFNNKVTVVAPGEEVYVIKGTNSYDSKSGTSFAAPQVSALAAMVKANNHSFRLAKFKDMLKITSNDLGADGYDVKYGYGLIDFSNVYGYITNNLFCRDLLFSSSTYVYDGSVKTPGVTVGLGSEKLIQGTDYTVSYAPGRAAVGTYKVTATGIGRFTGSTSASFTIVPPLVKGIKAPSRGKKKLTVRWKAMSKKQKKKYKNVITGYQVRVATKSNFSNAKYASVKGIKKTKKTVKGLKKKTTYYVQYRSYKTVGSATYYSKWSSTKKAKTK